MTRQRPKRGDGVAGDGVGEGDERLALATLRAVMRSARASGAARTAAARSVLEARGVIGRHVTPPARDTSPANEVSLEALEARIAALEAPGAGTSAASASVPAGAGTRRA